MTYKIRVNWLLMFLMRFRLVSCRLLVMKFWRGQCLYMDFRLHRVGWSVLLSLALFKDQLHTKAQWGRRLSGEVWAWCWGRVTHRLSAFPNEASPPPLHPPVCPAPKQEKFIQLFTRLDRQPSADKPSVVSTWASCFPCDPSLNVSLGYNSARRIALTFRPVPTSAHTQFSQYWTTL